MITTIEHSELPWKVGIGNPSLIFDAKSNVVAEIQGGSEDEKIDKAFLILSAVNSHERLLSAANNAIRVCLHNPRRIEDFDYILTILRAAIAAAEESAP